MIALALYFTLDMSLERAPNLSGIFVLINQNRRIGPLGLV